MGLGEGGRERRQRISKYTRTGKVPSGIYLHDTLQQAMQTISKTNVLVLEVIIHALILHITLVRGLNPHHHQCTT